MYRFWGRQNLNQDQRRQIQLALDELSVGETEFEVLLFSIFI